MYYLYQRPSSRIEVNANDVAQTVAQWTGIPLEEVGPHLRGV